MKSAEELNAHFAQQEAHQQMLAQRENTAKHYAKLLGHGERGTVRISREDLKAMAMIAGFLLLVVFAALWATGCGNVSARQAPKKSASAKNVAKPECDPSAKDGMSAFGFYVNSVPYKCSPDGKWVENIDAENSLYEYESRKAQLARDMQTRVLTDKEFKSAISQGESLFAVNGGVYSEGELQKEFNEAVLQQTRLRLLSEEFKNRKPCQP